LPHTSGVVGDSKKTNYRSKNKSWDCSGWVLGGPTRRKPGEPGTYEGRLGKKNFASVQPKKNEMHKVTNAEKRKGLQQNIQGTWKKTRVITEN